MLIRENTNNFYTLLVSRRVILIILNYKYRKKVERLLFLTELRQGKHYVYYREENLTKVYRRLLFLTILYYDVH